MPVDPATAAAAVEHSNIKTFGDAAAGVALGMAQSYAGLLAGYQALAPVTQGAMAKNLIETDPIQSASAVKILTGRESSTIGEAVALSQILMKGAQTTPPITGAGV